MRKRLFPHPSWAVTLMELLVVVLIISVLATVATGIYTGEARRARIAAAQDLIRQIEVAVTRYEVDTGAYPPSGSGNALAPGGIGTRANGSGYLHLALVHSMSGNALQPAAATWHGPYLNLQAGQTAAPLGVADAPGAVNILDPWGMPILYVNHDDYAASNPTFWAGTLTFTSSAPAGANRDLPAPNPFAAKGETYYNPNTYQIISFGPNHKTFGINTAMGLSQSYAGAEADDVTNFGY